MEFTNNAPNKKFTEKQIGAEKYFAENNLEKIKKIVNFFNEKAPFMLVNGFMGTGKELLVHQAMSFLNDNVITLKYNCFETTILDDILLEFFDTFKKLITQGVVKPPKIKVENFTQRMNAYFESIENPIVIVINSFEQVLQSNKQNILDFLTHLSKYSKIKIIIVSRKFNYDEFTGNFERISVTGFDKGIFEKYLRSVDIKQIGPLSDEFYKNTRGYYFYTVLSTKIMAIKNLSLHEFLSEFSKSYLTFNDFILRKALSLADPVSGHLFRFLTIMRHPVSINLLKKINLYDEEKLNFFVSNMLINREGAYVYLQDYYKIISENSIAENIAIKIHKNCSALYKTQLPLKPLERDLLISRRTMRCEIEYHEMFIPQKPMLPEKAEIIEPEIVQTQTTPIEVSNEEKDEQIKDITFVFDSEADEMAIMNKIAVSINKFVNVSDKKHKTLEEIENKSLSDLINLAKECEKDFDWQKIIMIYQKALTLNTDENYYTFLPTLYTKLAEAFKNTSDWYNSQKYYELATEFYKSAGDREKYYEYRYEIANICYLTYKTEQAENILLEVIKAKVSRNLEVKSKLLLSDINSRWPINIPRNISGIEKPTLAELYFKYALEADKRNNIETAITYYKKCIETSHDRNINPYVSSSLSNLASIYTENGQTGLAVKYLHESIRLDELSENYNGIYIASMKLAEIYAKQSPYKANDRLKHARACADKLNDPFYVASCEITLGDLFAGQKDYKSALMHYNEAYNLAKDSFTEENLKKIETRINDIKKVYYEG